MHRVFNVITLVLAIISLTGCGVGINGGEAKDEDGNVRIRGIVGSGEIDHHIDFFDSGGKVLFSIIGSDPITLVFAHEGTPETITAGMVVETALKSEVYDFAGNLRYVNEKESVLDGGLYRHKLEFYSTEKEPLLTVTSTVKEKSPTFPEMSRNGSITYHFSGELVHLAPPTKT